MATPNLHLHPFVREAGISKSDNLIDMRQLEACIRSELDLTAQRRIAVLDPVKLIVDNYPEDKTEYFDVANNPNSRSQRYHHPQGGLYQRAVDRE